MSEEKLGLKIEAEEAGKLDPAKRGVLADDPEVEGQGIYVNLPFLHYATCPWCHYHGRVYGHSHYDWYECRHCGHHFRH
jgi:hypothetical protein